MAAIAIKKCQYPPPPQSYPQVLHKLSTGYAQVIHRQLGTVLAYTSKTYANIGITRVGTVIARAPGATINFSGSQQVIYGNIHMQKHVDKRRQVWAKVGASGTTGSTSCQQKTQQK